MRAFSHARARHRDPAGAKHAGDAASDHAVQAPHPPRTTRRMLLHACVRYAQGSHVTNQSLRERFDVKSSNAAQISRLIKEAIEAHLIKPVNPDTSPRYREYLPDWLSRRESERLRRHPSRRRSGMVEGSRVSFDRYLLFGAFAGAFSGAPWGGCASDTQMNWENNGGPHAVSLDFHLTAICFCGLRERSPTLCA